jgi:hypothetical protein
MRKIISLTLLTFLLFGIAGCSTLQPIPHDPQSLLNDFQWSISAACSEQWLTTEQCLYGTDVLLLARGFVTKDIHTSEVAIRKSLIDSELKLPSDSKLRPYLDVLIQLLPAE